LKKNFSPKNAIVRFFGSSCTVLSNFFFSSSPLKDYKRSNISTSEAVESSNNTDLVPENVITEMEVGSFEAVKIKESEEEKDPVMDHIETPTLEHIDEFTLQGRFFV
jgi:hypothetical protein